MHNIPAIEDQNTEFKVSFNTGVIESLVAFANASGGTVYVGVDDSSKLLGIQLAKESVQNFVNEIKSKTALVLIPDVDVIGVDGKQIVAFQIQEYPIKPVAVQGRYYKQVGDRVGDRVSDRVSDRVGDKLSETQKNILILMQQNPYVSAQSLSEEIGISKRKIEENIRTLREKGKIAQEGNAKSGYWKVLD